MEELVIPSIRTLAILKTANNASEVVGGQKEEKSEEIRENMYAVNCQIPLDMAVCLKLVCVGDHTGR